MSFSSTVKNELCRVEVNKECCLISELSAVIRISGITTHVDENGVSIRIITENASFARKLFSLIKKLYSIYPQVIIRKSKKLKKHVSYIIDITSILGFKDVFINLGINPDDVRKSGHTIYGRSLRNVIINDCCKKAYLRGAFLAAGSVSDPEKTYHLEITCHSSFLAEELCDVINGFGLKAKIVARKGNFVVYLKEGEDIVDFLNIIGAHSALMELENIRILKEMRNNVNRVVNCETANLQKTVNASVRQVENIRYVKETMGLENLPESLREIAEMRLEYSDASLKELGEMLSPPLGKSGVNHRLRKLDEIAEDIRGMKNS